MNICQLIEKRLKYRDLDLNYRNMPATSRNDCEKPMKLLSQPRFEVDTSRLRQKRYQSITELSNAFNFSQRLHLTRQG